MGDGRKITAYLDVASFYSYLAYLRFEKDRPALESHGVEIEYVPVFLGGINHGSGNKPPWTLPAKGKYTQYETARAKKYFDATHIGTPKPFPANTLLPMRCMGFIKARYGAAQWQRTFAEICKAVWSEERDTAQVEQLRQVLTGRGLFTELQADEILAAGQASEWKDVLKHNTQEALDRGAFGAPWMWVRNSAGSEEPFFGSDRMHMIWQHLGLPWSDIQLQAKL